MNDPSNFSCRTDKFTLLVITRSLVNQKPACLAEDEGRKPIEVSSLHYRDIERADWWQKIGWAEALPG